MRLRCVCTIVALYAVLWTSGCCSDGWCCRHHFHQRDCGCACESSCYAPSPCNCGGAPPMAPVVIPAPTPVH